MTAQISASHNVHKAETQVSTESPAQRRYEYYVPNLEMTVEHPSGGVNHHRACTHYISARDIVISQRGFLHNGSHCKLVLKTVEGNEQIMVSGRVTLCKYQEGGVHEVTIEFDQQVDPRHFVAALANVKLDPSSTDPKNLKGRVLLIDDEEAVCRLVAHHVRNTMVDLVAVTNLTNALAAVRNGVFDLAVCELTLEGKDPVTVVQMLRQGGHRGAIVGLFSHLTAPQIRQVEAAGVASFLRKPYVPNELLKVLANRLCVHDTNGQAIYSTLGECSEMRGLITWYIQRAQVIVAEIITAQQHNQIEVVTEHATVLVETAGGYGYALLEEVAQKLVAAVQANPTGPEVAAQVHRLESYVRRMR